MTIKELFDCCHCVAGIVSIENGETSKMLFSGFVSEIPSVLEEYKIDFWNNHSNGEIYIYAKSPRR